MLPIFRSDIRNPFSVGKNDIGLVVCIFPGWESKLFNTFRSSGHREAKEPTGRSSGHKMSAKGLISNFAPWLMPRCRCEETHLLGEFIRELYKD